MHNLLNNLVYSSSYFSGSVILEGSLVFGVNDVLFLFFFFSFLCEDRLELFEVVDESVEMND